MFCKLPNLCFTGIFCAKLTSSLSKNGKRSSNPLAIANLSPTNNKPGKKVLISKYKLLLMCCSGVSYFSLLLNVNTRSNTSRGLSILILE